MVNLLRHNGESAFKNTELTRTTRLGEDNIMETKTTKNTSKKKKKMTPEERRAIKATIVPQNRSMKSFVEHLGEVWVKDPMLLL